MVDSGRTRRAGDEFDLDRRRGFLTRGLGGLVPVPIARRAVAVSVSTDREAYDLDEPVAVTVEFANRLPVPISVPTPTRRRWGWAVDGLLEASDERRYVRRAPSSFDFRPRERKRVRFVWNGRIERTDGLRESVLPEPGEHELSAFVATDRGRYRPSDATTIAIR